MSKPSWQSVSFVDLHNNLLDVSHIYKVRWQTHISLNLFELNSELEWRSSSMIAGSFPLICILSWGTARNLSDNQFGGLLPDNFGGLNQFTVLDLSHNNFSGTFPPHFRLPWPISHLFSNCKLLVLLHLLCLAVLICGQIAIDQGRMLWIRQWFKNCYAGF